MHEISLFLSCHTRQVDLLAVWPVGWLGQSLCSIHEGNSGPGFRITFPTGSTPLAALPSSISRTRCISLCLCIRMQILRTVTLCTSHNALIDSVSVKGVCALASLVRLGLPEGATPLGEADAFYRHLLRGHCALLTMEAAVWSIVGHYFLAVLLRVVNMWGVGGGGWVREGLSADVVTQSAWEQAGQWATLVFVLGTITIMAIISFNNDNINSSSWC